MWNPKPLWRPWPQLADGNEHKHNSGCYQLVDMFYNLQWPKPEDCRPLMAMSPPQQHVGDWGGRIKQFQQSLWYSFEKDRPPAELVVVLSPFIRRYINQLIMGSMSKQITLLRGRKKKIPVSFMYILFIYFFYAAHLPNEVTLGCLQVIKITLTACKSFMLILNIWKCLIFPTV